MKKYYVNDTDLASVRHHDRSIAVYIAFEVDNVLHTQAHAALSGMNAAKAISSRELEIATKLSAESKPEIIDSERIANDLLTQECENKDARITELEQSLQDLTSSFNAVCNRRDEMAGRIAELEKALREAMGWDWLTYAEVIPTEVVAQCEAALSL